MGIVVSATLRTRRADADVPFGVAFEEAEDLLGAVSEVAQAGVPLWHLAVLNPQMTRARGLGEDYLLFGAYPGQRAPEAGEGLRGAFEPYRGRLLPAAEAYRVWGERFFPIAPSRPTPSAVRQVVSLAELSEAFRRAEERSEHAAVQGTVSRSGEVLLLIFDASEEGWV